MRRQHLQMFGQLLYTCICRIDLDPIIATASTTLAHPVCHERQDLPGTYSTQAQLESSHFAVVTIFVPAQVLVTSSNQCACIWSPCIYGVPAYMDSLHIWSHCTAAEKLVMDVSLAGPAEQSVEEAWQKLQEHPDILAVAPDDEVLAEMLAVQVCPQCFNCSVQAVQTLPVILKVSS